jgi:hypothetical protein
MTVLGLASSAGIIEVKVGKRGWIFASVADGERWDSLTEAEQTVLANAVEPNRSRTE